MDKCIKCRVNIGFDDNKSYDGYCIACWPGYDVCARQGCGDYRCEHVFEETKFEKLVYSKDCPEDVGKIHELQIGCMVYHEGDIPEGHCNRFIEPKKENE